MLPGTLVSTEEPWAESPTHNGLTTLSGCCGGRDSIFTYRDSTQACPPLWEGDTVLQDCSLHNHPEKMHIESYWSLSYIRQEKYGDPPSPNRGYLTTRILPSTSSLLKVHIVLARSSLSRIRLRVNELWVWTGSSWIWYRFSLLKKSSNMEGE